MISERTEIEDTSKDTQIHSKELLSGPNAVPAKKNLFNKIQDTLADGDMSENLDLESRFTMTIETKYEYMFEEDGEIKDLKAKHTFNRVFDELECENEVNLLP